MNLPEQPKDTSLSNMGEYYENSAGPALTVLLTLIDPTFGAAAAGVGGLLSYANSQRSKQKNGYLAHRIKEELEANKEKINKIDDNFHEAVSLAIRGVQSAISIEKIDRLAKIVSGHIVDECPWDETASALRAIESLEDIHIKVLSEASLAIDPTTNKACFYIKTPEFPPPGMQNGVSSEPTLEILSKLNGRQHTEVRMFCMELMAKGFLHDNDQGTFSTGPVFTLTDAAFWLLSKIEDVHKNQNY